VTEPVRSNSPLAIPTIADVYSARRRIEPYVRRTPLYRHPAVCELLGTDVWVKHENHQAIGVFKIRGAINLASQLTDAERRSGIVTASTGNHGQSVAQTAQLFGMHAVVAVPEGANPLKVRAMERLGAEVIAHGRDFDAAREFAERLAAERGCRYVHVANEPPVIAGVATETLEVFEDLPEADVIIGPVGGGSGMAGACVVAGALSPQTEVIAVQAAAAPAAYRSWKERRLVEDKMETAAEGVATRVGFELTQRILWDGLADFVLVSEDEIKQATRLMIETTRSLVEPAGALALAAALRMRDRLAGRRVVLRCTGANISPAQLRDVLV
jgi:threonine dehydratase